MGFFLLGRGPNDDLALLSDVAHATKSDAMAELSRLTADPGFAHWDAEVFVVDMDAAMPVLLVRPATAEKEKAPDAVEAEFEESAATIESPEVEAVVPVGPAETEIAEETAPEIDEALVVEEPIADAVLADAEEAEAPEEAEGTGGTLKDALMRTAAQMESEGIVAPESVGPAEESAEQAVAPGEASWPWDVAQDSDAASTGGFSLSALEEPSVDVEGGMLRAGIDDETFAAAKPVILGAYGNEDVPSVDTELPVESAEESAPEPEVEPVIAPEPEAASVIAPEPEAASEIAPEPEAAPEIAPEPETVPEIAPEAETAASEPDDEVDEISDFIFDLEASIVESAPGGEAVAQGDQGLAPAPEAVAEVVAGMSCEDCVYVATCPNKDQRDPATCGSFQWK